MSSIGGFILRVSQVFDVIEEYTFVAKVGGVVVNCDSCVKNVYRIGV